MRQLGYVELFFRTLYFSCLPYEQQLKVQKRRLQKMVGHVRSTSPFFARHYAHLGDDFSLTDLPPTSKQMMMEHFDDWMTDPSIKMADLQAFMADKGNLSKRVKGKYMVSETSGSTGYPAVLLQDSLTMNVPTVLTSLRVLRFKLPVACILIDDSFGIYNGMVRQNVIKVPLFRHIVRAISAKQPIEDVVRAFDHFHPRTITGYPGTIELLAHEVLDGRLKLRPSLIMVAGENLNDKVRAKLEQAFRCPVHTTYGCTEGGAIAFECRYNHLHVHHDWCILEPVDEDNRPVPPGETSAKVLLTNLANQINPIIRYEVTDRVVFHENCPCGRPGGWFEIEGRTTDVVYLEAAGKRIGIAPMLLYDVIEVVPGVRHFQVVLFPGNRLELRLVCMNGCDRQETFERVRDSVMAFLARMGVENASMNLSELGPQRHPKSGKFKQIYQVADEAEANVPGFLPDAQAEVASS